MPALVDLINRSRREYVITIEREIAVVHERGRALVSQREVRGTEDEAIAVARQALRENPDVLVIESLRTPAMVDVALEAAAAGQLVVGGFAAPSATSAVESLIHLYPEAHHRGRRWRSRNESAVSSHRCYSAGPEAATSPRAKSCFARRLS